jgi:hypothetical protein
MEIFQRLMDEQAWREQQAQKLSSGLGSMPYSFQEQMDVRAPVLQKYFNQADNKDMQSDAIVKSLENQLGPKPNWFEERYQQQHWLDHRKKGLESIYKGGI